jgi:hypothetical protein
LGRGQSVYSRLSCAVGKGTVSIFKVELRSWEGGSELIQGWLDPSRPRSRSIATQLSLNLNVQSISMLKPAKLEAGRLEST